MISKQSNNVDYYKAYQRQKLARQQAEQILEEKSIELYNAQQSLKEAYDKLKSQKAQIVHQEKLASVGQLAAGVAHEVNNPVAFIKSNLSTLKTYLQDFVKFHNRLDTNILSSCDINIKEKFKRLYEESDIDFLLSDSMEVTSESLDGIMRIQGIVGNLKNFARPDLNEFENF